MFHKLNDTFSGLFRKFSGKDAITESNVRDSMAEVRSALLDADVHLDVVNVFCEQVLADALGQKVHANLEPGQQMIGIVHKRLVELLGGTVEFTKEDEQTGLPIPLPKQVSPDALISRASTAPTVVMMCGLQGSGKTTTCGKLAAYLKKRGRSVMLAACDLQRPAAVEQLRTLATQVESEVTGPSQVVFYGEPEKTAEYGKAVGVAVQVAQRAVAAAKQQGIDTVILDTAGRLHINDELMGELSQVKATCKPHHVFLVVDAMTGQDAVSVAESFSEAVEFDGVVISKLDGDARGGAALSVKAVTGKPIMFASTGEKLDAFDRFHPDRMAGRILGMGDVLSLIEKAEQQVDADEAEELQRKMATEQFTLEDFLKQMRQVRKMGPIGNLLGMMPGMGAMKQLKDVDVDEGELDRVEAIILSMTREERLNPEIIKGSRRRRIAEGSGTRIQQVNNLVKQFGQMRKLMKQVASGGMPDPSQLAKATGRQARPRIRRR